MPTDRYRLMPRHFFKHTHKLNSVRKSDFRDYITTFHTFDRSDIFQECEMGSTYFEKKEFIRIEV